MTKTAPLAAGEAVPETDDALPREVLERYRELPACVKPVFVALVELFVAHSEIGESEGAAFDYERIRQRFAAAGRIVGVDVSKVAATSNRAINKGALADCERALAARGVSMDWIYCGDEDLLVSCIKRHGLELIAAEQAEVVRD